MQAKLRNIVKNRFSIISTTWHEQAEVDFHSDVTRNTFQRVPFKSQGNRVELFANKRKVGTSCES